MTPDKTVQKRQAYYYISLSAFLAFLGLLLFALVDIRRGFLFAGYFKVGAPSVLLNLSSLHLPLLLAGGLGLWIAYRYMKQLEEALKEKGISLKTPVGLMAIVSGVFLVIDLFIYRGVPASRFVAAGKMSAGAGAHNLARSQLAVPDGHHRCGAESKSCHHPWICCPGNRNHSRRCLSLMPNSS